MKRILHSLLVARLLFGSILADTPKSMSTSARGEALQPNAFLCHDPHSTLHRELHRNRHLLCR
jgi:hypothetical protein